jgi:DNA polymerase III alpha subunit
VNTGRYLTHLTGTALTLGFIHIKGLDTKLGEAIPRERTARGPYQGLADLICRLPGLGLEPLVVLIRTGALRALGSKQALLWQAHAHYAGKPVRAMASLFATQPLPEDATTLPPLETRPGSDIDDERELLGFTTAHPFTRLPPQADAGSLAADLPRLVGKRVQIIGYYIARKHVRTVKKETMAFGCWIDAAGTFFDTVHFPDSLRRAPLRRGFLRLGGKVAEEFGHASLEVDSCEWLAN